MPAVSEQQRKLIFAKFGAAWAKKHHFDNKGPLPSRVSAGKPQFAPSSAPRKRK